MQSLAEFDAALGVVAQPALEVFPLVTSACMQSIADSLVIASSCVITLQVSA
jgi:hypothetical protein